MVTARAMSSRAASIAHVRAYFEGLVRDLLSPEGRQGCLLVNSAIESAATDPEVAAVVRGHLARLEVIINQAGRLPQIEQPAATFGALDAFIGKNVSR